MKNNIEEQNIKLAELLFPNVDKEPAEYEKIYPKRDLKEGAFVTRLGPSPTGFIHLGNLYGAFADERLAHQSGGVFYLRIEDTDDKRYVDGALDVIINSLRFFGINFDEGALLQGEKGNYGRYVQSERKEIYQTFAKKLIEEGKAYPCFLTEEEISTIRDEQEKAKETPGIYGKYAKSRDLSFEEIKERIDEGEKYVIRLRSEGNPDAKGEDIRRVKVEDGIRGTLEVPENFQDVIILKANGIPTYHFAHAIDDHFMRTTHVVRGAEWLSSLPIHVELFDKLGFEKPVYCHTAQLMKLDENGNKRKLSKRKDPELSLDYYRKKGYHKDAVREYLLTILNSNFEEWRIENPDLDVEEFKFSMEKMSNSGALFDINKLKDISKDVLLKIPAEELYDFLYSWAKEFREDLLFVFEDKDYLIKILDLGRKDKKPRKDLIYAEQIIDYISYFFEPIYEIKDDFPEEIPVEDRKVILEKYLETYDPKDDQSQWFEKIRDITKDLGYAVKPKDFKKHPEEYKGHVGHVSTGIRVALMGRKESPDIWEIQNILEEDKVRERISKYKESL